MPNVRVHPPVPVNQRTVRVPGGRTYTGVPGTPQDVPDFDARPLTASGWMEPLGTPGVTNVGTTAQRPANLMQKDNGTCYVDTSLGVVIFWDGANWRNTVSGAIT